LAPVHQSFDVISKAGHCPQAKELAMSVASTNPKPKMFVHQKAGKQLISHIEWPALSNAQAANQTQY
jgi:hypothetical protein